MFIVYGVLALTHIVAQMIFGHLEYRRQKKENRIKEGFLPTVAVIVPVYNEDPQMLDDALMSMAHQDYKGVLKVYVVDDGSKNVEELKAVYNKYSDLYREKFIMSMTENQGKRRAQVYALDRMRVDGFEPEVVVTVDSDTFLLKRAITQIVQPFSDWTVAAATGQVLALNKEQNLLTRLINYRYWMAFNQERAAQSFFKVLMCCSGPFSAYRGRVMREVAEEYISQTFFGKYCTYGDDRHLTNLILERGWNVVYNKDAIALTHVPVTLKTYLKQQLRWNKSFYREMLWTLKAVTKHNWYLVYDLTMQFILPFLLIGALIHSAYIAMFVDHRHVFAYIGILMGVALLRVSYGLFRTKDFGFYWFLIYGFFHVLFLIPNRFLALLTINDGRWGTR